MGAGARRDAVQLLPSFLSKPRGLRFNPPAIAGLCDDPSRMLVAAFAEEGAKAKAEALAAQAWTPEVMAVGRRAAYLWCVDGISAGQLGFAVDRALKTGVTARNLGTMTKLRELAAIGGFPA